MRAHEQRFDMNHTNPQQHHQDNTRGNRGMNRGGRAHGGRGGHGGQMRHQQNQQQHPSQHHPQQQQPGAQPNMGQQQIGQPMQPMQTPMHNKNFINLPNIDITQLDKLAGGDRNNFVGNNIYNLLMVAYQNDADLAGRITGMLLDENAVDFTKLLTDSQYFNDKKNEAYSMLMSSQE